MYQSVDNLRHRAFDLRFGKSGRWENGKTKLFLHIFERMIDLARLRGRKRRESRVALFFRAVDCLSKYS